MKQMKQLVTAFVLLFVSLFAYSSTMHDCYYAILPGLKDTNNGWYIANPVLYRRYRFDSFEDFPGPDWGNDQIIRLYNLTCKKNKMWNNSSKYKVPDQVSEIKPTEPVAIRNVTAFGLFSEENKRWTAKQVGLDYDSVKYGLASISPRGSTSSGLSNLQEIVLSKDLMIIEASLIVHLYNVTMNKTKFDFTKTFNKYCDFTKANESLQDYGEIMDICGTHYFESVILGGRLWFRVFVSMDAYKADPDNMKQLAVDELERYFFINTTQSGKIEFPGEVGREYFQLGSIKLSTPCDDYLCNYSYWLKHLPEDPYIVGGQLMAISDLTADKQDITQFESAIKLKLAGDYTSEMIFFFLAIETDELDHNLRNVIGFYEMFGDWRNFQLEIQKWAIPFHGRFHRNNFVNATDDELLLVGEKTKKTCEFKQIVGDNYRYRPCEAYISKIVSQCVEAVQHKWKSLNALQITEPCCALYDLWNCALQSNCSVCAQDEMDKYQAFMVNAVSKSLCSTVPYHKYDQLCILEGNNTKVDFNLTCPVVPITKPHRLHPTRAVTLITSKGTYTWLIVMLVLLIIAIVGTLIYIVYYYFWIFKPRNVSLVSQEKVEDTKKASEKQVSSSIAQVNSKQAKSQVKNNLKETKSIAKEQSYPNKINL